MYVLSQEGYRRKIMLEERKIWRRKIKWEGKCSSRHSLWRAIFGYDALACEKKTFNLEIKEMFIADSGLTSHIINSLRNMTNIWEVKTAVKTVNKKTTTGSLWGYWKGYHKRDSKSYLVTCNDTAYITNLTVNIFLAWRMRWLKSSKWRQKIKILYLRKMQPSWNLKNP